MTTRGGRTGVPVISLLTVLGLSLACTAGGERSDVEGDGTGGAVSSGDGDDHAATGGLSLGGYGGQLMQTLHLPFAVDDHYVPYGFMGAAIATPEGPGALVSDPNQCKARPEGAQGRCHNYKYVVPTSGDPWAGLYWLSTFDNWGQLPGRPVESGALEVAFVAASEPPGAPVMFVAGGLSWPDAHADDFNVNLEVTLTGDLEEYSLTLTDVDYDEVLGGFGFFITSTQGYSLYIDDIRWK